MLGGTGGRCTDGPRPLFTGCCAVPAEGTP